LFLYPPVHNLVKKVSLNVSFEPIILCTKHQMFTGIEGKKIKFIVTIKKHITKIIKLQTIFPVPKAKH
jgi:hypothetical protein